MANTTPTTRRGFLGRTVAALAAASTANVAVIATTRPAAAAIAELPELVAAGRRLETLHAEWLAADAARLAARAVAKSTVPAVPDEIICRGPTFGAGCTEEETDVEGKRLPTVLFTDEDGRTRGSVPRRIASSYGLRRAIEEGRLHCDGRTSFGKRVKRMIATAEQFEADTIAALERSGLEDATRRAHLACQAIDTLAREVAVMQPQTIAGAAIMARVLSAYIETESYSGNVRWGVMILGAPIAEAVARLG